MQEKVYQMLECANNWALIVQNISLVMLWKRSHCYGMLWNVMGALWTSYGTLRNPYGKY